MTRQSYRNLKWLLGLLLLLGLIWWVASTIGWGELARAWQGFPVPRLLLLVTLIALSYLTRALRLHDLYRPRLAAPFRDFLRINVLHTTLLNLLPMRTGEAAFPVMMKRYYGERYTSSVVNLLWLRVADLWVLLWLGALIFATQGVLQFWPIVAAGAVLPLVLQLQRKRILDFVSGSGLWGARLLGVLVGGIPESRAQFLRLLLWTLATWVLKLAAFVSVVAVFVDGPVLTLVPGIVAAEISNALPVQGVAGFGSYEAAMVLGGAWSSYSTEALLLAAVNLHLFVLACTLLFGAVALVIPMKRRAG